MQENQYLDVLLFQMDDNYYLKDGFLIKHIYLTKNILKFYDPEENMEFLNRLFDVLGIIKLLELDDDVDNGVVQKIDYNVSKRFLNYNEKYTELMKIMYKYDFNRCYEIRCECEEFSAAEVEIAYKIEDYFKNLRVE